MLPCVSFYPLFLEVLERRHWVAILSQAAEQLYDISILGWSVTQDLRFQILPERKNH